MDSCTSAEQSLDVAATRLYDGLRSIERSKIIEHLFVLSDMFGHVGPEIYSSRQSACQYATSFQFPVMIRPVHTSLRECRSLIKTTRHLFDQGLSINSPDHEYRPKSACLNVRSA